MKHSKQIIFLALGSMLLFSCAKEKDYELKDRDPEKPTMKLSDLPCGKDLKSAKEMLYVPMTMGTPRQVAEANPFYQGDTKVVKCVFTEDGIEVVELEEDDRFQENDLNHVPVLAIPGVYKKFQCAEDAYGDCTNKEEEDSEVSWNKKDHIVPDFGALSVKEVNMLDLTNIEGDSCVTPQGVKMKNYEVSKDGVLNIELEKTYKLSSSWKCIRNNYYDDKLSYNSFKVRFFYSMVAVDKLASKNYEPLEYPIEDHDVYGFFKTEKQKLNSDFDGSRKDIKFLANRWSPEKKVLKYYLSKSFNKESNAPILKATMKSMAVMNKNLKASGAKFQIEFVQQTESDNISPGDLRYSSLVLIDDPLANGLLGYAPSVKNPATGEIVQSHINMYGGVLTSGTRWMYENAVDVMIDQKSGKVESFNPEIQITANLLDNAPIPTALKAQALGVTSLEANTTVETEGQIARLNSHASHKFSKHIDNSEALNKVTKAELSEKLDRRMHNSVNLKERFDALMSGEVEGVDELDKRILQNEVKEHGYALDHSRNPEFFPIAGTTKVVYPGLLKIKNILDKDGILKRWDLLNDSQKAEVKTVILVNRYTATLVHEMGHSLGLRHNFAGSTDGENFYSKSEAQALGMVDSPAYSSVMDYSTSVYNQLGAFGKYDVAALGYAYSGAMTTKNGAEVKYDSSFKTLKNFRSTYNSEVTSTFNSAALQVGIPQEEIENAEALLTEASVNSQYPVEVRDTFKSILKILDSKIVDFEYCTDENASLSTKCNRFDEGTTLVEIAKHKIERYKNIYKYRNFRNNRNNFSAYGEGGYIEARYNEFFYMRDIVEDYEFFASVYGKETMINGCSPEELAKYPACQEIQDRINSIELVGDFFIEVLKTPDLLCAVANKANPNVIVEYKKLADIYDTIKYRIDQYIVTSCFDQNVKDHIAKDDLVVVGENGKFLNGFKDTHPKHKYVTDIGVRGVWADKVMAFRMLFQRRARSSTTDNQHMALVDHPAIMAKAQNVLRHYVLGKKLDSPIPFTMENGQKFRAPYVIGNDYTINQLQDSAKFFKEYLDMPKQGSVNLIETILGQVKHIGVDYSDDNFMDAYITTNYVTVDKKRGAIAPEDIASNLLSISTEFATYVAGNANGLAHFIMQSINKKPVYDKAGEELIAKIIKQRTNPDAPADLTDGEKAYFSIDPGFQVALINLSGQGTELPESEFVKAFGEEVGPIIAKLYAIALKDKGARLKEVSELRDTLLASPTADASEVEKSIFNDSLEVLNDYLTGAMSEEVFDFYKNQLRRLQLHEEISNI
jgi:hypothetical protein